MKHSKLNPMSDKKRRQLAEENKVKAHIKELGNGMCELCQERRISGNCVSSLRVDNGGKYD